MTSRQLISWFANTPGTTLEMREGVRECGSGGGSK